MNMDSSKVFPGDKITAQGYTFTVWRILYQDNYDDVRDVEFIDDRGRYHHWKQQYDGGNVIRAGQPGVYFRDDEITDIIAAIIPARTPGTWDACVITQAGTRYHLGRYSFLEAARVRLDEYAAPHALTWREM